MDPQPVPFGAGIQDSAGNPVGPLGQGEQVFARTSLDKDQLRVKWGDVKADSCTLRYQPMPQGKGQRAKGKGQRAKGKGQNTDSIQQFSSTCE